MSQSSFGAVSRLPNAVASVGRIKRSYLLDGRAPAAAASNDPMYPQLDPNELVGWARRAEQSSGFGDTTAAVELATDSVGLQAVARAHRSASLAEIVTEMARATAEAARRGLAAWRRQRDRRATERALRTLDARTLRDIGFDPSEVGSVAMELSGEAEITRSHALLRLRFLQI